MHPKTRQSVALRREFRNRLPGISENGLKKMVAAANYGASPAQLARIYLDDKKANAENAQILSDTPRPVRA